MKDLWIAFAHVMAASFSILGWIGTRINEEKPPIPTRVVTTTGEVVVAYGRHRARPECLAVDGRHGSRVVRGHGGYVAPDWNADWLHRELLFILKVNGAITNSGATTIPSAPGCVSHSGR